MSQILSCPPDRQQRCVGDDAGHGRERHRRYTEVVFPRVTWASFHWWAVPQLFWRHRSVTNSTFLFFPTSFSTLSLIHNILLPCSTFWQCGQGELYAQPAALSTRTQSGHLSLSTRPPETVKRTWHNMPCWMSRVWTNHQHGAHRHHAEKKSTSFLIAHD